MGTGQSMPVITTGNSLENADTLSNVATNKADVAAQKAANVDNKDIFPNSATMQHLSAADAIIHGAFKSGSLDVGVGGVSVSSAANGGTPSTGLLMSSSSLQLIKAGEAIVTLNGTDGSATFKGTIQAGSSISGTMTAGTIQVGAGGVTIGSVTAGIGIAGNKITCVKDGTPTVTIDGDTGIITASKVNLTTDSGSTVNLSVGSITIGAAAVVGATTLGGINSTANTANSTANTANGTANQAISDASSANSNANGRISATQNYIGLTAGHVTSISTAGVTIGTATSGARVVMDSSGMNVVNSAGTTVITLAGASGVSVNNVNSTPGVTERISLNYNGTETGWLAGYSGSTRLVSSGNELWVAGDLGLTLTSQHDVYLMSGNASHTLYLGTSTYPWGAISLNSGPTISTGSAPSEGGASSQPKGSLLLSTGGSLWLTNASDQWTRIYGANTAAATAHP